MQTVKVHDLLQKRALVTRESANPIRQVLAGTDVAIVTEAVLDFSGVDAVTPSFVDELLAILDETLRRTEHGRFRLLLVNPPTRLSAKFLAVARARDLQISESDNGTWIITGSSKWVP